MASHIINTRSHADPDPPAIFENLERILWQTSRAGKLAADRNIPRTKSLPEKLAILEDLHFNLHHTKNIFRTRSQGDLNQADFETVDLQ